MKNIKLFFLLISITCYSQEKETILIVPMKSESIEFDKSTMKMLKSKHLNIDSVKNSLVNLNISKLTVNLTQYSFINIQADSAYGYLISSLSGLSQWNSVYLKKIIDSKGFEKVFLSNNENPQLKYYGRNIREKDSIVFRELIKEHNCKYISFLNKFEISKCGNSFLSLHVEIYNQEMNKIYGSKNNRVVRINQATYTDVFNYYIKSAIEEHYEQIKGFLKAQD